MRSPWAYTGILAGVLAAFFGGTAALWVSGHTDLYFSVMHGLGVDAYSLPFLDLRGVLAMGECHRLGVDPTIANPCDPLRRVLPYGPLLLHEPFATADAAILGPIQSLMFLAVLVLVLRPRTRGELAVTAIASVSCGTLYALERGNFDLVEFLLVALGVFVGLRGFAGRLASYILFWFGGAVKFYPFALLLAIARERLAAAIGLAILGLVAIAGYILANHDTLAKLSAALPPFEYNTDVFGAACLPFGLADWLTLPVLAGRVMMWGLLAGFSFVAWRTARRLQAGLRASDFAAVNFQLLLAGAVILFGCFFMGPSITYRSVFLLLLLPGLFDLARRPGLRRLAVTALAFAILCLWSEFLRQWGETAIDHLLDLVAPTRGDSLWGELPSMAFFVGREVLWWWLIALMGAIIGVFLSNACATRQILGTSTQG